VSRARALRRGRRLAGLLVGVSGLLAARSARAHEDITFPYGAPRYVPERLAARAGLVVVPSALPRGARAPLVVFFHGLNQDGPLHKGLGAPGTADMRVVFERLQAEGKTAPFLVAAPSQTRDAARPWGMWQAFDLGDFVEHAAAALAGRAEIDRAKIVVLAHSGGGCNLHGSALRAASARAPAPHAVVLADTCFDQGVAETLLLAAPSTRLFAYYQTHSWERDFGPFQAALFANRAVGPRDRRFVQVSLPGGGAHDRLFQVAVERAFPELLPPSR
jgi:poly(3-hydroxybutyrate) depolymerase